MATGETSAYVVQDLNVALRGRTYGTEMEPGTSFRQDVPEFLIPITEELLSLSALLKLDPDRYPDRDAIYDAYAQDVRLFQGRVKELEAFAKAAIRASIKPDQDANVSKQVDQAWRTIEKHVPQLGHVPLIDFPAERAALPAQEFLCELQDEVRSGVTRLLQKFCFWLDSLVWEEYVGLVDLMPEQVGKYFYFRWKVTEEVTKSERHGVTHDPNQPYGQRFTYKTINGVTIRTTESLERHDHHIVHVEINTLEDYPDRLPSRVCALLETTPQWLRRHLCILSGIIVKEAIRGRMVREHEETMVETSEWKGSPTVALGHYALAGWSFDDLKSELTGFYNGQKARDPARRKQRNWVLKRVALAVLGAGALVVGIWYLIALENKTQAKAYQAFYAAHVTGEQQILTVAKDRAVTLPEGQPLYYLGKGAAVYTLASDPKVAWQAGNRFTFQLPNSGPESRYGTIDLGPVMGIPASVHVLSADEKVIRFTIDYNSREGK